MKSKNNKKSKCKNCNCCCRHISIEIDKPTSNTEYDYIIWYLLHKNVMVWIGHDNHWYVEFKTSCKGIKEGKCKIYHVRPDVCRKYDPSECINSDEDPAEKHLFKNPKEFLKYLNSKKIKYNGKYK